MKKQNLRNSKSNVISIGTARKRIQPASDMTEQELNIFNDIVRGVCFVPIADIGRYKTGFQGAEISLFV
jgi:hypothetical protein